MHPRPPGPLAGPYRVDPVARWRGCRPSASPRRCSRASAGTCASPAARRQRTRIRFFAYRRSFCIEYGHYFVVPGVFCLAFVGSSMFFARWAKIPAGRSRVRARLSPLLPSRGSEGVTRSVTGSTQAFSGPEQPTFANLEARRRLLESILRQHMLLALLRLATESSLQVRAAQVPALRAPAPATRAEGPGQGVQDRDLRGRRCGRGGSQRKGAP